MSVKVIRFHHDYRINTITVSCTAPCLFACLLAESKLIRKRQTHQMQKEQKFYKKNKNKNKRKTKH